MRKLQIIILLAFGNALFCSAQTLGAKLKWSHSQYDFGDIYQGEKVLHTYSFKNIGELPLIITNVSVTCGCTTPKGWVRDPIEPGASGEITIAFDSTGKLGKQRKVATIISNSIEGNTQLIIECNIIEPRESR